MFQPAPRQLKLEYIQNEKVFEPTEIAIYMTGLGYTDCAAHQIYTALCNRLGDPQCCTILLPSGKKFEVVEDESSSEVANVGLGLQNPAEKYVQRKAGKPQ